MTFDFSPLFRSSVGFDRLQELLNASARANEAGNSFPPYNIERTGEDDYRITMAVAGFSESDLSITSEQNVLTVTGSRPDDGDDGGQFLHRGIAGRSFERRFQLADHIKVTGASLENGLLHVNLVKELPEAMKPQTIAIERSNRMLEGKAEKAA